MTLKQNKLEMRAISAETTALLRGREFDCDADACRRAPTHALRVTLEVGPGEEIPAVSFLCLSHAQLAARAGNVSFSEVS